MPLLPLALADLTALLDGATGSVALHEGVGPAAFVVDLDGGPDRDHRAELHSGVRGVVVGVTGRADPLGHPAAACCDVVVAPHDPALAGIEATFDANPLAATALAVLLRGAERRPVDDGLLAESATYSALQAGPELAAWRAGRPRRNRPADAPDGTGPVLVDRVGDVLTVTLHRPHVRNALDTPMRDALVDAFALAAADPSITRVELRGDGPAFCSGGDLDEFGSFSDPASAHLLRLQQSVGRAVHAVRHRTTAFLHGACAGSGIELPAFAGRVVAAPDTVISLPEVALGLVPGAGGTVSLPRRIGRHRTALLALGGTSIDARTALAWGLVDTIEPG